MAGLPRPDSLSLPVALALALALAAGACGRRTTSPAGTIADPANVTTAIDLTGVPCSDELAQHLRAGTGAVAVLDTAGERRLALFDSLEIAIQRPATRSGSGDRLYALWRAEPASLLWLEAATRYEYLLHRGEELAADLAARVDSVRTPAAYWFAQDCREYGYGSRGAGYRRAAALSAALSRLDRALAEQKLAMVEADGGAPLVAVQRLLALLAPSEPVGPRLAVREWYHVARYLLRADRLDDALHAAAAGARLADALGSSSWRGRYLVLAASLRQERRESAAALALLRRASDYAQAHDLPWLFLDATDKAAALAGALGRPDLALEFDRRTLAHSLAMADSLNVPRNLMNLANDMRLIGRLDSCLVYQERARVWVQAYDDARNQAMLPLLEAEYYCQIGNYAKVTELLTRASQRAPGASLAADEARLHIGLIRQQLELGRPELALRSVARLQHLRAALHDATPDQNLVADYETATAEYHLGQGEYEAAAEALARAGVAVGRRGGEGKLWLYHLVTGKLAQRRGDLTAAATAFRSSLAAAEAEGSPDQRASSRFHLGHCLLELGQWQSARDLFAATADDGRFGSGFRTRLSTLVFLGRAHNEEGRAARALAPLARADSLITPYTPADLTARLRFEQARALRTTGAADRGARALRSAATELARTEGAPTREFAIFTEHLRRDIALEAAAARAAVGDDEGALAHALAFLGAGDPFAATVGFRPRDWLAAQPAGARLVITLVGETRAHAWYVDAHRTERYDLPARPELLRLAAPVLADAATPRREPDFTAAARLARAVLGTALDGWPADAPLHVLADDILQGLPWAALMTEAAGPALLELGPVVELQLRSAAADPVVRGRDAGTGGGLLLAAGVNGAAGLPEELAPLHHAEDEARAVAAAWRGGPARACLGDEASWPGLRTAGLERAAVIHFATHAVVSGGGAVLQLAGDAPGDSPTLPMIASTPLLADLVFLSCCDGTRRRHVGAGSADLAGAFLAAGARRVIASSMRVDDRTARDLALAFYEEFARGTDPAAALRAAQQRVRAQSERTRHPYYWAFFRLIESAR
ncbi:CHAT domain-containing protein [bacterium]|nr:CHAT domain-containing protein [bacterium]